MDIEFLDDLIYTFLILPIIVLFQKHFTLKNKGTSNSKLSKRMD